MHTTNNSVLDDTSRFFNSSKHVSKVEAWDLTFLKEKKHQSTELLRIQGVVFLNEIYDMLGFTRTRFGATNGWALGAGQQNTIDFGLDNHKPGDMIVLTFNVDGDILSYLS